MRKSKIAWLFKQLLPRTYRSHFTDGEGRKHFSVWKMFLGRVYDSEDVMIAPETT